MAKMSPSQTAARWQARVTASVEAYKAGVAAVTINPAQQAIAAKQRWIDRVNEAAAAGRYEDGLAPVTLQSWKAAATDKGASNIAAGARTGAAKVEASERVIGPQRDAIVAGLPARGTLDQNIERSAQMARGMAALAKRR